LDDSNTSHVSAPHTSRFIKLFLLRKRV